MQESGLFFFISDIITSFNVQALNIQIFYKQTIHMKHFENKSIFSILK